MRVSAESRPGSTPKAATTRERDARRHQRRSVLRRGLLVFFVGLAPLGLVAATSVAGAAARPASEPIAAANPPAILPTTLPQLTVPQLTSPQLTAPPAPPAPPVEVTVVATVVQTSPATAPAVVATPVPVTAAATVAVTTTVGPVSGQVDLCVAAGLVGSFLTQCQANAVGGSVVQIDLCEASGLVDDELTQCQAAGDPSANAELCVASGLIGDTLAQCQADAGDDSIVDIDLCAAAGTEGVTSPACAADGDGIGVDDGVGDLIDDALCLAAGLTGLALAQCEADAGGGGDGDSTIEIELCAAAGLTGDELAQCQAGEGPSIAELCVAAGFTGAALAQCQASDSTIVEIELCAAGGLSGDALAACIAGGGPDLRQGGVFTMSNDPQGNEVVAFFRADDGTLTPAGTFSTDGLGSGGFEDASQGLVLGSTTGENGPTDLVDESNLLFAANAGSDDISVFQVNADGLELVDVEPSNGLKPVSITVNEGVVYVLNSDETIDGTADALNCREGANPSVTGFRIDDGGDLTPIADSTRSLSGGIESGCAQVSFNPTGTVLVVTQRTAELPDQAAGEQGSIDTFVVNADGTLGQHQTFGATGVGPFGFAFTANGALLTAEQSNGPFGSALGAAAGYQVNDDGSLIPSGASVGNGGTGTGSFVVSDDGTVGFTTSFFGDGRISSYAVGPDGSLELLQADADPDVSAGASDLSFGGDSRFLYELNSLEGTISAFEVGPEGSLLRIDTEQAHEPSPTAAPFGLAAT